MIDRTARRLLVLGLLALSACSPAPLPTTIHDPPATTMLLGLRTATYHVADLDAAKAWYTDVLGFGPYFDEPFYVGFDVGGFELGLMPAEGDRQPRAGGTTVYWGVEDADAAYARLLDRGATRHDPVQDVGGGIRLGTVTDPFGNVLGVIYNPHFGQGGHSAE